MSKWFVAAMFGALFVVVTLQSVTVRSAGADSSCQDWEVQWFNPTTTPTPTGGTHPDPGPRAAPVGWEPFGGGASGYALRRCVH